MKNDEQNIDPLHRANLHIELLERQLALVTDELQYARSNAVEEDAEERAKAFESNALASLQKFLRG